MLSVQDFMTSEVNTLSPEMTLREAVERLSAEGFSGAPVVAGSRLAGVVTASDILDFEATNPGVPAYRGGRQDWGEWGPPDLWREDLSEPPSGYFRDMWADSAADVVERISESEGPEWDFLAEHVVGEVMTRAIVALSPEATAAEAARLMVRSGVHRLLVTQGEELVGIVSSMDFVRAVAEGKLGKG
ncbi:MAG: CBS domain-containing protein [Gemmatimonadota bacterium]